MLSLRAFLVNKKVLFYSLCYENTRCISENSKPHASSRVRNRSVWSKELTGKKKYGDGLRMMGGAGHDAAIVQHTALSVCCSLANIVIIIIITSSSSSIMHCLMHNLSIIISCRVNSTALKSYDYATWLHSCAAMCIVCVFFSFCPLLCAFDTLNTGYLLAYLLTYTEF